jgi:RNase P/RNase MRP subunit p29
LDATQDSIIVSNPSSAGTDSAFVFKTEQLNTGVAKDAIYIDNRGTGNGLRIDDTSGDTTPFIVDADGRVGIGTSSISTAAATERLLQVGSETNRGNNVTYGEVVTKGLNRHTALTGIKDVFLYDTTTDSDGGRWIDWATTDKLSWYTETLDDGPSDPCDIANDDRCYNPAFPRKAILVVTTSALYIFDAATNDMWMKFNQNASGYALGVDTNNDPSSVTAANGVVYVGTNGSSPGGLYAIDFTTDRMWNYDGTDRAGADAGIASRNSAISYNVDSNTKLEISPVGTAAEWERINDVSVAVITNSRATSTTGAATNIAPGNGKTFIALATDSGLTLINPTAPAVLQYSDVTADDYTAVHITRQGKLYGLNTTSDQLERWDDVDTDKASEVNGTYTRKWDETVATGSPIAAATPNMIAGAPDALEVVERGSIVAGTSATEAEDLIYIGHSLGLTELHDSATQGFGWVKYYNTTKQTPLMVLAGIADMVLPMDDTSGTQAQDLLPANTDMAILGTPTLGVNGVAGKAIQFDNTNDYLCSDADQNNACDNDTAFNMTTVGWTLSLWFKHSTTAPASAADTIFERCVEPTPAQAAGCVIAYMTTTGTIVVANDDDAVWTRPDAGAASYDLTATSTLTYNDNQWHQLIITRTNASDVDAFIDGAALNLSNATGNTLTIDDAQGQVVTIGASCSTTTGANCAAANATNFWDGAIDDVQFAVGTAAQATTTTYMARRHYNMERPRVNKRIFTVTDATSATSTSLTDTGESWLMNELAGQVVEVTGSTDADCVGVTRRIVSNTATSLTFTPAVPGACTLDTSADFEIDPEALYGATDSVYAIGITAESPLGEARQMCVGTNNGSDAGGVTCYNHQAGPSVVADIYNTQASKTDDFGTDWTGTDYDDIRSIDLSGRALIMASEAHITMQTEDVRLGQGLDYLSYQIWHMRNEILNDGIFANGAIGPEVGFTGGADLAERYYSNESLAAGELVAIDQSLTAGVKKTAGRYQRDVLGVVATEPGLILGAEAENGYPIALVGRVPVRVTNENGQIYAGDRITTASRPGYGMFASQAGRVIGQALSDAVDWVVCEGEDSTNHDAPLCTTVLVFVNLSDYYGQPVELAMAERDATAALEAVTDNTEAGLTGDGAVVRLATAQPTREEKIMAFLKTVRDERAKMNAAPSEVFTDRVAASTEIITPKLVVDEIFAKSIKADSIEGLSIWTDQIASLQAKYAGLETTGTPTPDTATTPATIAATAQALRALSADTLTLQLDGSILGRLSVAGALTIGGEANFQGDTLFGKLATFLGETVFQGRVNFVSAPTFGSDTAGFASIEKGAKKVRVSFETPYEHQPIVAVTLTNDVSPLLDENADADLRADVAAVEADYLEAVFEADLRYVVTEKDQTGFTIILSEKAPRDLQFSWVAIAVKKPKSFTSEQPDQVQTDTPPTAEEPPLPEPEPTPVPPIGESPVPDSSDTSPSTTTPAVIPSIPGTT